MKTKIRTYLTAFLVLITLAAFDSKEDQAPAKPIYFDAADKELYERGIFGFENSTTAMEAWKTWVDGDASAVTFTIDHTQGANGTSGCAKIIVNTPGVEIQLFTKGNTKPFNAILKSNKSYTFSFLIKSPTLTELWAAGVENASPAQEWHNFAWWGPIPDVTSEWTTKHIDFTTGDLSDIYAEGQANNAYALFKFKPETTGTYYIDEVSLKEN